MGEQTNTPDSGGLRFWHSLIVGVVGTWFLTAQRSEHHGDVFAHLTNLQRLVQPGFLGEVLAGSAILLGVGTVCWLIGRAIPSLRKHSALLAMVGTGAMLAISLVGENSFENQKAIVSSSRPMDGSTVVMAEWKQIGGDSSFSVFIDTTLTTRTGDLVKMWDMTNYSTPQQAGQEKLYLSAKQQKEFDCKEKKLRVLTSIGYSEKMGHGDVVGQDFGPTMWSPISPDSIGASLWLIACK